MKIGILTFHRSYNFGANLQALAVQSVLLKKGCSPIFVNYQEKSKIDDYRQSVSPMQVLKHENFFERYYIESIPLTTAKQVEEYCLDSLDAVLVGSDAVFRLVPKYDPVNLFKNAIKKIIGRRNQLKYSENLTPYWLDWKDKDKNIRILKASVAASCMDTLFYFFPLKLRREMKRSLENFDFVSVRDQWTEKMVKYLSNKQVVPEICPDPVFSLKDHFVIPNDEYPTIDVTNSILMSGTFKRNWVEAFTDEAHKAGYRVCNLPNPEISYESPIFDMAISLPLSPLQWYLYLSKAGAYIGTRFHALVSCISNGTPVVNVENHTKARFLKRSSKMFDLCERASINQRHFNLQTLQKNEPSKIVALLFDYESLVNMRNYSNFARTRFSQVIDYIIQNMAN